MLLLQALPVAAVGCTSLRQLLSEEAVLAEGAGTLLHAAVRSESITMVSLLLDLGRYGCDSLVCEQMQSAFSAALRLFAQCIGGASSLAGPSSCVKISSHDNQQKAEVRSVTPSSGGHALFYRVCSATSRYKWDLRARAEPGAQTALHLAANMDDEGRMAGLLLHHPSCPEAGMLWSILKNAAGQTPADIAFRCAHPGLPLFHGQPCLPLLTPSVLLSC